MSHPEVQSPETSVRKLLWLQRTSIILLWILAFAAMWLAWKSRAELESRPPAAGGAVVSTEPLTEDSDEEPPEPEMLENFELIERSGRTVTRDELIGRPWVASFIFTRCAGPCPRVSGQMRMLQDELEDVDVRLVTITVDPKYDTPEVLTRYADAFGADPEKWLFLTGEQEDIYRLITYGFKQFVQEMFGEQRRPGFEVVHTPNVLMVDADGYVVGKYNATFDTEMAALRRALLKSARDAAEGKPSLRSPPDENPNEQSNQAPEEIRADEKEEERIEIDDEASEEVTAPVWVTTLPAINAGLNSIATLLLIFGYVLIRQGKQTAHKKAMLSAFGVSIAFLACYLVYHFALDYYTGSSSKPFRGTGTVRTVYLSILVSHVILAAVVPVLAAITIYRGLREQWDQHRRIAKITFPIWLYVSVTGVVIYGMLYHWPQPA